MAGKKVTDVSHEYPDPASDAEVSSIKTHAVGNRTGLLERNVDAVLRSKGVSLDEPLAASRTPISRARPGLRR